ncbi:MAG: FAD-binding oxidoreductase, partial [Acidimicrobiales bacterium]|nr:FAD-binding oxidoreductase [Acidimicrobiales bacterium]
MRALDELSEIVGAPHLLTSADDRAPYEVDWTGRFRGSAPAVVRPGRAAEVAAVVDVCRAHGLALVPQGGNTGLVGGGVPLEGEVVLSLRRLDAVGPVDAVAHQATAGAGATVGAVQAAAAEHGLRYAVDFAARDTATVGGTVATNAGGVHVLRYGSTREQVLGVEAVLGDGHRIDRLEGLVKDNTGYHLASLLCGSEGTLGVVTAARLRLTARLPHRVVALVAFDGVRGAVEAVAAWRSDLGSLEAAELVLEPGLRLVCEAFGLPRPFDRAWPAYVLVEAAAHHDPTDDLAAAVRAVAPAAVAVAPDRARGAELWRYREDQTLAVATVGTAHKLDVTVPLAALTDFVEEVPRRVAAIHPAARTWIFGHLGDGNLHVNVTGVADGDDTVDELVLTHVAELGGSISAEHGVGTAKRRWLHLTRSAAEIAAMRSIKRALDPDGIL